MAFWLQQHIGLRVLISFSIASRCRAKWAKRKKKKNVAKQSRTVQKENRKKQCKGNSCFCSLPMPSNAICGWPKSQLLEMKTWIRICCCNLPNTLSPSIFLSRSLSLSLPLYAFLFNSLFLLLYLPFRSSCSKMKTFIKICIWFCSHSTSLSPPFLLPFCPSLHRSRLFKLHGKCQNEAEKLLA